MLISPRLGEGCCVRQAIRHERILPPSWMRSFFHHPTLMPGYNKNMPADPPFCGCFLPYQGQTGCHKPNGAFQTTSTCWHRRIETQGVTRGSLFCNYRNSIVVLGLLAARPPRLPPAIGFTWVLMGKDLSTRKKLYNLDLSIDLPIKWHKMGLSTILEDIKTNPNPNSGASSGFQTAHSPLKTCLCFTDKVFAA